MRKLFTSESVSEVHPDKIADQISDAVLDRILAFDPEAKVACETLVTSGHTVIAGEIKTKTYVDVQQVAREVINEIGYTKTVFYAAISESITGYGLDPSNPDVYHAAPFLFGETVYQGAYVYDG